MVTAVYSPTQRRATQRLPDFSLTAAAALLIVALMGVILGTRIQGSGIWNSEQTGSPAPVAQLAPTCSAAVQSGEHHLVLYNRPATDARVVTEYVTNQVPDATLSVLDATAVDGATWYYVEIVVDQAKWLGWATEDQVNAIAKGCEAVAAPQPTSVPTTIADPIKPMYWTAPMTACNVVLEQSLPLYDTTLPNAQITTTLSSGTSVILIQGDSWYAVTELRTDGRTGVSGFVSTGALTLPGQCAASATATPTPVPMRDEAIQLTATQMNAEATGSALVPSVITAGVPLGIITATPIPTLVPPVLSVQPLATSFPATVEPPVLEAVQPTLVPLGRVEANAAIPLQPTVMLVPNLAVESIVCASVTRAETEVRSLPSTSSTVLGQLASGTPVLVRDTTTQTDTAWYFVAANAVQGWIPASALENCATTAPATASLSFDYQVQNGDTLLSILNQFNLDASALPEIQQLNNLPNLSSIQPGMTLLLPLPPSHVTLPSAAVTPIPTLVPPTPPPTATPIG